MFSARLMLLPAMALGALAVVGVHGCASSPSGTGFGNDDGGGTDFADDATGSGGGTSSSSGSGPSGSSSGTVASSGSSSSGASTAPPCAAPGTLVDNMLGMGGAIITCGGRMGFWYTYDDGTAGGTLTPTAGMPFSFTAISGTGPAGGGPDGGPSTMAAKMSGTGFTVYGAGMGFDLNSAGGTATKGSYNASAYSGISFWAMGSAGGVVRFNVPDKDTDPSGGVCSGTGTSQCTDDHGATLALTTSWQQFKFTWSQLTQQGYGYVEANIDTAALVSMKFQVNSPTGTFDVWVTDIAFTQ